MKTDILEEVRKFCAKYMNKHIITDQHYGTIQFLANGTFGTLNCQRNNPQNNPIIIIVLESPHTDEFIKNKMCPLVNDKLLLKYLHLNLNNYIASNGNHGFLNGTYDVYLMNSIQHQCSLGFSTKYFRDIVFLSKWEKDYIKFESRLRGFISNNKVVAVVNLVTAGNHSELKNSGIVSCKSITGHQINNKFLTEIGSTFMNQNFNSLNDIVDDSILKVINNNIIHIRGNHPSSWHLKKNRNLY